MKREDLVGIGLDDEQIKDIFRMRGKELEAHKSAVEKLEKREQELTGQLEEEKAKFEELSGNAITKEEFEALRSERDEFKTTIDSLKGEYEDKINEINYNHALDSALTGMKARDNKLVKAILNKEEIKLEDGKLVGLDEQVSKIMKTHDYLFETEEASSHKNPVFVTGGSKEKGGKSDAFQRVLEGYKN